MHEIDAEVTAAIPTPSRTMAPVWWYGGKGNLARTLMPHLPDGRMYVEPYCGAASMFWHLNPPRKVEVLNDLNGDIVNLFRVLQDPAMFETFAHRITWTLYSFAEFQKARRCESDDPIDRAWAFFVRQNQGFSGKCTCDGDWGRVFTEKRGMADTACNWRGRIKLLSDWHNRLSRVQLDSRDALDVIRYWDSPDTVFYLDPPYIHDTRAKGKLKEYKHECDDDHHRALVDTLLNIQGQAMLSGYAHPIYESLESAGWRRLDFETACHAAGKGRNSGLQGAGAAMAKVPRTETVWIKQSDNRDGMLF